eukprot:Tbor_TRINITY_DN842_c0_g1::TRINITY_DN842_c0_g1_i1::g.26685::m.26685
MSIHHPQQIHYSCTTCLHFITYLGSDTKQILFKSNEWTRNPKHGYQPECSLELDRKQLRELSFGTSSTGISSRVTTANPSFGPQWQIHMVPVTQSLPSGDTCLKYIQLVLTADFPIEWQTQRSVVEDEGACCLVFTVYDSKDYYLLLHSLHFLRTTFNKVVGFSVQMCDDYTNR